MKEHKGEIMNVNAAQEIIDYMKSTTKSTPVKVYVQGELTNTEYEGIKFFGKSPLHILFGDAKVVKKYINENASYISDWHMENDRCNSGVPMLDLTTQSARIEAGAMIRDQVKIGENAIIMMGAVINIGAEIGSGTMIDMNAVLGARATVGKNSHIGAGAILAGVLEPPSATPVIVGDGVMVGANAVILEGVQIGDGAVVAAGAVVTQNVPANTVVAGTPAKIVKTVDAQTDEKTQIVDDLRK